MRVPRYKHTVHLEKADIWLGRKDETVAPSYWVVRDHYGIVIVRSSPDRRGWDDCYRFALSRADYYKRKTSGEWT